MRDVNRTIEILKRLPPDSQELVASLIEQLAEAKGIGMAVDYKAPSENIDAWITKLKSERRSERTVELYTYLARQVLAKMPRPTKAEVREYLARRLGGRSRRPSSASGRRSVPCSAFSTGKACGRKTRWRASSR